MQTVGDIVIEAASGGADTLDTVMTGVNFVLGAAEEVEIIILTGASALNATGSDTDNTIVGNTAVNTMTGGLGDDTFVADALDVIIGGAPGVESDTAKIAFSANLATLNAGPLWESIENITLTGKALLKRDGRCGRQHPSPATRPRTRSTARAARTSWSAARAMTFTSSAPAPRCSTKPRSAAARTRSTPMSTTASTRSTRSRSRT